MSTIAGFSFLTAVVCELPLMVSEMCMLKAGGIIDWDEQKYDLILQVIFILETTQCAQVLLNHVFLYQTILDQICTSIEYTLSPFFLLFFKDEK